MRELVVVATHGDEYVERCTESLDRFDVPHIIVRTDGRGPYPGTYPTGAYLWAYENLLDVERFLFIQDSMVATADPLPWFREQLHDDLGVVAWGLFNIQWDSSEQEEWTRAQYPGVESHVGVFGPIFYTTSRTLRVLRRRGPLPAVPRTRWQSQGTERAWALACVNAEVPLYGKTWTHDELVRAEYGPFKKTWGGRP
jgi:hypothetical protein